MFGLTKLVGPPAMGADGICSYSAVGMALGAVAVCLGVYVGGLVGGECQRRIQRWVHRRFWQLLAGLRALVALAPRLQLRKEANLDAPRQRERNRCRFVKD